MEIKTHRTPNLAVDQSGDEPSKFDDLEYTLAQLRTKMHNWKSALPLVEKLGNLGDVRAAYILLEIAAGGPGVDAKSQLLPEAATNALRKIGRPVIPALRNALQDTRLAGRAAAAKLLLEFEGEDGKDAFIHALQDKDSKLVRQAAHALGQLKCTEALSSLLKILGRGRFDDDKYDFVRRAVVSALGEIAKADAVGPLVELLENENEFILINETITALTKIGNPEAFGPLLHFAKKCTDNIEMYLRYEKGLVEVLVATAGPTATEVFVAMLSNQAESLAVECIKSVGHSGAILPLLELAQRRSNEVTTKVEDMWMRGAGFIDPVTPRQGIVVDSTGRVLATLYSVLEREAKHASGAALKAIAEIGPIKASVYFMHLDNDDLSETRYCYLETDRIKALATNELARRQIDDNAVSH